jgi:hypothetical protein
VLPPYVFFTSTPRRYQPTTESLGRLPATKASSASLPVHWHGRETRAVKREEKLLVNSYCKTVKGREKEQQPAGELSHHRPQARVRIAFYPGTAFTVAWDQNRSAAAAGIPGDAHPFRHSRCHVFFGAPSRSRVTNHGPFAILFWYFIKINKILIQP